MQRPTSVTVLGILNIVFGLLGICGGLYTVSYLSGVANTELRPVLSNSPVMNAWMWFSTATGLVATLALVAAGVGLLNLGNWARKLSIAYALYCFAALAIGLLMQTVFVLVPMFTADLSHLGPDERVAAYFGAVGAVIGTFFGLIYPAVLWYFMRQPHVVAACNGQPWQTDVDAGSAVAAMPAPAQPTNNPYASPLAAGAPQAIVASGQATEAAVERLIPLKNKPALFSYYLGLFSLFPVLGLFLAIPAFVLGIMGLNNARNNPRVHGKVHAWIGVVCGFLFGLGNLALWALIVIGIYAANMARQ